MKHNHRKILFIFARICIIELIFIFLLNIEQSYSASRLKLLSIPEGYERIFLSLRVLSNLVSKSIMLGNPVSEDCRNLAGICYIEGYIIDQNEPGDIIIYGLSSKERPGLQLDDLVVNMRNIANGHDYPYCSLDPKKENVIAFQKFLSVPRKIPSEDDIKNYYEQIKEVLGPQEIKVGGVPRDSRQAHVMIDADYHMKKVSQGHIALEGITSMLDYSLNDDVEKIKKNQPITGNKINMSRFWFHLANDSPAFQRGKDIVVIDTCNIVILTEKQMSTELGELVDVKEEDDPYANIFAGEMSDYLKNMKISSYVAVYVDLENLFRLRSLLLSMDYQAVFNSIGWSFSTFLRNYKYINEKPMEPDLPCLVNYKEYKHKVSTNTNILTFFLYPMVCGGVGMDMKVNDSNYRQDISENLYLFRILALKSKRSKDDLFWKINN